MVELLAPAGTWDALVAAVEAGANAVYLAGSHFGARAFADNFGREEMERAVRFAHLRHVLINVTVNTIVDGSEMAELADYLRFLRDIGVDAVLVQDLGVAKLAREIVPDLPLHASTQMTVHSLEGVRALEELGFTRVVLSRELTLKDIRYICSKAKAEIEVFMHGALCVCYSGQCLMSSLIGGRSGNRGACAQPCRLPYTLVDEKGEDVLGDKAGKFLLSPRDINTIEILPELITAGVASLKIEGRMKRPEYVATVVSTYRQAIDSLEIDGAYMVTDRQRDNLTQIFNRDFTTAYMEKPQGKEMMSDRRPNNRGLLVGRVTKYDRNKRLVTVKLAKELNQGDEVDFWVKVGGRVTAKIDKMTDKKGRTLTAAQAGDEVTFPIPGAVRDHDRMFKVYDAVLMERAHNLYKSGAPVRRLPVKAQVSVAVGEPLVIKLTDQDGYQAEAATEFIGQAALKRPLSRETIEKQLARMGTSIFALAELELDIQGEVMVPVSEINEARRRAVEQLEELRLQQFKRPPMEEALANAESQASEIIITGSCDRATDEAPTAYAVRTGYAYTDVKDKAMNWKSNQSAELVVAVDSLAKAEIAIRAGADAILFGGESYSHKAINVDDYRQAAAMARQYGRQIYFNTPRLVREYHQKALEKLLTLFQEEIRPDAVYVHNIGTLHLVKRLTDLPIRNDFSLIVFNNHTINFLREYGVEGITLSPELNLQQVKQLAEESSLPLECMAGGRLELMVSEYCVTGSFLGGVGQGPCSQPCTKGRYFLKDRKDAKFPLAMDQFCHMHILNSRSLSMLPFAGELAEAGVDRLRIDGRYMEQRELEPIIRSFKDSLSLGVLSEEEAAHFKEIEGREITRGHYFRGVVGKNNE